jgi:hypothetical protein
MYSIPTAIDDLTQRLFVRLWQTLGQEIPVKIPHGETVIGEVQLAVGQHLPSDGVELGEQMTPHPIHVHQVADPRLLVELSVEIATRGQVAAPPHGFVRDPQRAEDLVVEAILAQQKAMDLREELAGLGSLDHAMVVRARDGQHFADTQTCKAAGIGSFVLGRVVESAGSNDDALQRHQSRHRQPGSYCPRVGQRDGGIGEVIRGELVLTYLADQLLVCDPEA